MLKDIYKKSPAWWALYAVGVITFVLAIRFLTSAHTNLVYNDLFELDQYLIGVGLSVASVAVLLGTAKVYDQSVLKNRKQAMENPSFQSWIGMSSVSAFALYRGEPTKQVWEYIQKLNPYAAMRIGEYISKQIPEETALQQCAQYDSIGSLVPGTNTAVDVEAWKKTVTVVDKQTKRMPRAKKAMVILCGVAAVAMVVGLVGSMLAEEKPVEDYTERLGVHCSFEIVALDYSSIYLKNGGGSVYEFEGSNGEEGLIFLRNADKETDEIQALLEYEPQGDPVTVYGSYKEISVEMKSAYSSAPGSKVNYDVFYAQFTPEKDLAVVTWILNLGWLTAFGGLVCVAVVADSAERKYRFLAKL